MRTLNCPEPSGQGGSRKKRQVSRRYSPEEDFTNVLDVRTHVNALDIDDQVPLQTIRRRSSLKGPCTRRHTIFDRVSD